jgi:signal transduction histidine kinase
VEELNMPNGAKTKKSQLMRFIQALALVWTVIIVGGLLWNLDQVTENTLEDAQLQALHTYEKDIIYRSWNTMHGGVYVPVTEYTKPNPYLSRVEERDITTPSGRLLTLINPAYMTRQVHEMGEEQYAIRGHITSLDPIRPENSPDTWETAALNAFEKGEIEVSSVEFIEDIEYMRLMRPLVTEGACLQCHAEQGYKVGDVRGGISVSVPMGPLWAIADVQRYNLFLVYLVLWLFGIGGIYIQGNRLIKSDNERKKAEEELAKYAHELKEANRMKALFSDIMHHDILNPIGVIRGSAELGLCDVPDDKNLNTIKETADSVIDIVDNANELSRLETFEGLEKEDLNLKKMLDRLCEESKPAFEEFGMVLENKIGISMPVKANPIIKEVFQNLLSNALKYAQEGKRVVIDAGDSGGKYNIIVKDFGPGIPDEAKVDIFERFKRRKKGYVRGMGIGLAIVKRLVELHGWRVWVEDNPVGGSVFVVEIPRNSGL